MDFKTVSLGDQTAYLDYMDRTAQKSSDYSFVNLFGWADAYGLQWAETDNLVWIRQTEPEVKYWAPVGDWEAVDWKAVFSMYFPTEVSFVRVPSRLVEIWETQGVAMRVEETRGEWDYLYDRMELVTLRGKRFHKKKNLVNRFYRHHAYAYRGLDETMIHQALDMQQDWCEWRDCESQATLAAENTVIPRVLKAWDRLRGVTGGVVTVNGRIAAYTVAEYMGDDTVLIHFEKGDTRYSGIYQAVNQLFLAHADETVTWVNRMQDLDDEGLRKAKLSYRPVDFVKKFTVTLV